MKFIFIIGTLSHRRYIVNLQKKRITGAFFKGDNIITTLVVKRCSWQGQELKG